jgi:hypothetical protein
MPMTPFTTPAKKNTEATMTSSDMSTIAALACAKRLCLYPPLHRGQSVDLGEHLDGTCLAAAVGIDCPVIYHQRAPIALIGKKS